jgi:hypothetical protein
VAKSVGIAADVPSGAWAGGNGAIGEDGFFAAFEENAVWGDLDLNQTSPHPADVSDSTDEIPDPVDLADGLAPASPHNTIPAPEWDSRVKRVLST